KHRGPHPDGGRDASGSPLWQADRCSSGQEPDGSRSAAPASAGGPERATRLGTADAGRSERQSTLRRYDAHLRSEPYRARTGGTINSPCKVSRAREASTDRAPGPQARGFLDDPAADEEPSDGRRGPMRPFYLARRSDSLGRFNGPEVHP